MKNNNPTTTAAAAGPSETRPSSSTRAAAAAARARAWRGWTTPGRCCRSPGAWTSSCAATSSTSAAEPPHAAPGSTKGARGSSSSHVSDGRIAHTTASSTIAIVSFICLNKLTRGTEWNGTACCLQTVEFYGDRSSMHGFPIDRASLCIYILRSIEIVFANCDRAATLPVLPPPWVDLSALTTPTDPSIVVPQRVPVF